MLKQRQMLKQRLRHMAIVLPLTTGMPPKRSHQPSTNAVKHEISEWQDDRTPTIATPAPLMCVCGMRITKKHLGPQSSVRKSTAMCKMSSCPKWKALRRGYANLKKTLVCHKRYLQAMRKSYYAAHAFGDRVMANNPHAMAIVVDDC